MTTMHNTPTIADTANLADATSQAACTATTWPPTGTREAGAPLTVAELAGQWRKRNTAERVTNSLKGPSGPSFT